MAAKGLRMLSHAERQPFSENLAVTDDDRSKRHPIYEQLGDPRIPVAGELLDVIRVQSGSASLCPENL